MNKISNKLKKPRYFETLVFFSRRSHFLKTAFVSHKNGIARIKQKKIKNFVTILLTLN